MLDSNPLLQHLRNKSRRTKNAIAIIAALIPTLAISYAQFYMRARDITAQDAPVSVTENIDNNVSIFAAVGKLFDEGKKTVTNSVDALKSIDASILDSKVITASGDKRPSDVERVDLGATPGVDSGSTTITKSIEN